MIKCSDKPIILFEKKKYKNCYEKKTNVNIDSIHIYPETVIRMVNHLVIPSDNFLNERDSEETIQIFHDSEDSGSTDLESSEDEPSSGYQTSEVKSPQILVNPKMISSVWVMHKTSMIYHCSDEFRNNLIICQFDFKVEKEDDEKGNVRNYTNLNIHKFTHFVNGEFSEVSRKICIILKRGKTKKTATTDTLTMSAMAIHLRPKFTAEVVNIGNVIEDIRSLLTAPDIADLSLKPGMWSQTKLPTKTSCDWSRNNPVMGLWRRLDSDWTASVDLKCDLPSVSFFLYNNSDDQIFATRMKSSGMFKTFQKVPQYQGALTIEAVFKDTKINRWQHLFHTDNKNKNIANVEVSFGLLDGDSIMENLEEVPIVHDRMFLFYATCQFLNNLILVKSISQVEDDSVKAEEKIRIFYREYIMK